MKILHFDSLSSNFTQSSFMIELGCMDSNLWLFREIPWTSFNSRILLKTFLLLRCCWCWFEAGTYQSCCPWVGWESSIEHCLHFGRH